MNEGDVILKGRVVPWRWAHLSHGQLRSLGLWETLAVAAVSEAGRTGPTEDAEKAEGSGDGAGSSAGKRAKKGE